MKSLEKFNLSVRFDNNLREVPNSPADMMSAMRYLVRKLEREDLETRERIKHLGLIGSYARILHEFAIAEAAITEAIKLCDTQELVPNEVVNQIRLAHIYQWQGHYGESNRLFSTLLERTRTEPEVFYLEDFVLQHTGKNYFDQEKYGAALEFFEDALKLRLDKGDRELIQSTKHAIQETKRRLGI